MHKVSFGVCALIQEQSLTAQSQTLVFKRATNCSWRGEVQVTTGPSAQRLLLASSFNLTTYFLSLPHKLLALVKLHLFARYCPNLANNAKCDHSVGCMWWVGTGIRLSFLRLSRSTSPQGEENKDEIITWKYTNSASACICTQRDSFLRGNTQICPPSHFWSVVFSFFYFQCLLAMCSLLNYCLLSSLWKIHALQ